MQVAVVGATGTVGREIVEALFDERARVEELPLLLATSASEGVEVEWGADEEVVVEPFEPDALRGVDLALVAVPNAAAAEISKALRELGVPQLSVGGADDAIPVLVRNAGGPALAKLVAARLPAPEVLGLGRVLASLEDFDPTWVRGTFMRSASALGQSGVEELVDSTARLLNGLEVEKTTLPHRLAFNVVPAVGDWIGEDTSVEASLAADLGTYLSRPLGCSVTVVQGPWFHGAFASVTLGLGVNATLDEVREAMGKDARLKLLDEPAADVYPMPSLAAGDDAVLVGRLRKDPIDPRAVSLVIAMDSVKVVASMAVEAALAHALAMASH